MLYSNMGSEMTPSSEAPPMGATESDTPWEVGLIAKVSIFGYSGQLLQNHLCMTIVLVTIVLIQNTFYFDQTFLGLTNFTT